MFLIRTDTEYNLMHEPNGTDLAGEVGLRGCGEPLQVVEDRHVQAALTRLQPRQILLKQHSSCQ